MDCVKLIFFMLYPFLCQLALSSSSPHLCPKDEALALLQFKHMFTVNPNASDYCYDITDQENIQSYPRTLSWNNSIDCCSWNGVHCDETTGQVIELDLRCSQLQGKFHSNSSLFHLSNLKSLDLAYNNFSGSLISPKFGEFSGLAHLDLSHSSFTGLIPAEISHLSKLHILRIALNVLNLRSNNLEGTIPQCLGKMNICKLDLSNNSLSGTINTNFSIGNQLRVISLHGNKLTGKVPRSLINCKYLTLLDLGNNQLNDTFPNWFGDLPHLQIFSLRSNKFHGPIKSSGNTNLFAQLQILDLSSNGFSGNLPISLFGNLQAMKKIDESTTPHYVSDQYVGYYDYLTTITTKGQDYDSVQILDSNMIIDLSKNRFEGHIPGIIGDLVGLRTLNLSHNVLEGHIPTSLQNLSVLESLDLSSNKISGEIPKQLESLTFLEVLNLSHNHLVGCIPTGKQFDSFENSSYQGNDGLHGFPLSTHCGGDDRLGSSSHGLWLWTCYWTVRNIHNVVNSISSMVFEVGCEIGTQNYYENEKARGKILVCNNLQNSSLQSC
uniref:Leucine-rich repeat-containing N-terminal plant-type domain-containing protein n=1 Tax=Solanum lycopersicum TaxID=4081 RepID=A0A3Q7E7J8_SOLLC